MRWTKMKRWMAVGWIGTLSLIQTPAAAETLYENDFEKVEIGKVPDDFLVLNGDFAVRQVSGNHVLELPGAPLDTFGVLFGPAEQSVAVSARAFSKKTGRRLPAFAVGLNGWGNYRLQVSGLKRQVELYKGDEVVAASDFVWVSGKWTWLKLQVRPGKEPTWAVEGKVWTEGASEPEAWTVRWEDATAPRAARASLVASPFSGQPILFDDLRVTRADGP